MLSRRIAFALAFTLVAFGGFSAAACGGSSSSSTPTPGKTTAPAATSTKAPQGTATLAPSGTAPAQASVTISDFTFTPPSITVKAGDTVTWTNNGPTVHTVTADDGSFDSGNIAQGKTYSHTFQSAGTVPYHCTVHPFMKATVIVQSGSAAAAPTAAAASATPSSPAIPGY